MEKGIKVNREVCMGCGQCITDCVMNNLILDQGKAAPKGQCLNCGHCVAICPADAVSIPDYEMQEVEGYREETFRLCPETFLRAVKFRRSIRSYENRKIEPEKLRRVVCAGVYTETAVNSQSVRFAVVQEQQSYLKQLAWEGWLSYAEQTQVPVFPSPSTIRQFHENQKQDPNNDRLFFNAPATIIVASKVPLDGGLASANLEMMAVAEGLGVMFDGYLVRALNQNPEALRWLGMKDLPIVSAMLIGYSAVHYQRTAPRKKGNVTFL